MVLRRSARIILAFVLVLLNIICFGDNALPAPQNTDYFSSYENNSLPPFYYANHNINVEAEYNTLFGFLANGKLTKKINPHNAFALELDYGKNENREGVTWVFAFKPNQLFKITAERLSENLPFDFASGQINQTIPQYGYGAECE